MISKEELTKIQNKLVALSEKKEDLIKLIQAQRDLTFLIQPLRKQLELIRKENEDLEQEQMKELAQATSELHSFKPENNSGDFSSKLKKLEKQLQFLKEKNEKLDETLISLREQNSKNSLEFDPLNESFNNISNQVSQYQRYITCIPQGAPISLQLADLEQTLVHLQHIKDLNRIEQAQKKYLELIEIKNSRTNELQIIESKLATTNTELTNARQIIMNTFNKLDQLSKMVQEVNQQLSQERCQSVVTLHNLDEMIRVQHDELKLIDEENNELEQKTSLIKLKQDNDKEIQIRIQKQNQLENDLQKKIDELRREIKAKREKEPAVVENTNVLELKWLEHEKILIQHKKMEKTLERKKMDKERKDIALREINSKWPMKVRSKYEKGLTLLQFLFDEANKENKMLAEENAIMQVDIETALLENSTLKNSLNAILNQ